MLPEIIPHHSWIHAAERIDSPEDRMVVSERRKQRAHGFFLYSFVRKILVHFYLFDNNIAFAIEFSAFQQRRRDHRVVKFKPAGEMLGRDQDEIRREILTSTGVFLSAEPEHDLLMLIF